MTSTSVGVWVGGFGPPAEVDRYMIQVVEQLGYASFWFGEAPGGREPFTRAATLLAATDRIVVGTGVASIWLRAPEAMAAAGDTLGEAFPGRFVLGTGVSHAPLVDALGLDYSRPLARMREYLSSMSSLTLGFDRPDPPVPRVIAALRPRMLELAAASADGAHPYFVPVEHTARAREIMGPDKLLIPEVAAVVAPDRLEARDVARSHVAGFYLGAENYVENLRWLGWSDDDLAGGGSDALVDAIVAWGDEESVRTRVLEHLAAGADQVLVQPIIGFDPDEQLEQLRRLAPALTEI